MSTVDYSRMTTDDLIQSFIHQANKIGAPFLPWRLKITPGTDEFKRAAASVQAIGTELRARAPLAAVRARLFENESPDVRNWAGGQLYAVDPEWAEATLKGLFHELTAQEVLAWRRRILQKPPRTPKLQDMTVPQLVARFVDASERQYGATRFLSDEEGGGPDMKAHNRIGDDIYVAAKELHRRGELSALLPLLEHALIAVRAGAARYCLPLASDRCIAVFEKTAAEGEPPESTSASRTLDVWRAGQYCAFPESPEDIRT